MRTHWWLQHIHRNRTSSPWVYLTAGFMFSSLSNLKANGALILPQKMDRPAAALRPLRQAKQAPIRSRGDPTVQLHKLGHSPTVGFSAYSDIPDLPLNSNSLNGVGVNAKLCQIDTQFSAPPSREDTGENFSG